MEKKENMELYEKVRSVPKEWQRTIKSGRLKGFTDIIPMWRIQVLTEQFGPAGYGWWYEITDKRLVDDPITNQTAAFVDILLYVVWNGKTSHGIPGTGGSSFVAQESAGPHLSDECFKMALTDAISVACKALGIGADVYAGKADTKYPTEKKAEPKVDLVADLEALDPAPVCSDCGDKIKSPRVAEYSRDKFGRALCYKCQKILEN